MDIEAEACVGMGAETREKPGLMVHSAGLGRWAFLTVLCRYAVCLGLWSVVPGFAPVALADELPSGQGSQGDLSVDGADATPWPVKVVVVSMFEDGAPVGDEPGELQFWVERMPLAREWPFPLGEFPLRSHVDGVLAVCTGGGIPNATASIMALGLDRRFDLSNAYWLIAGIAGGDPEDVSLGTAVWARHVVDGDLLYEIDGREIPEGWPYGLIPLGAKEPADTPQDISTGWTLDTIHFPLNADLAQWAYQLTRDHPIADTEGLAKFRAQYNGFPKARQPPGVALGDTLSASTYWHGQRLNRWANDWVRLYAGNTAEFMTTNMEDSGSLTALHRLGRMGLVDTRRVMVLRTVSNFSAPPADKPASWSVTAPYPDDGVPALEAAWQVGSRVVRHLIDNWSTTRDHVPGS